MKVDANDLARMLLRSGPRTGPLHHRLSEGLKELIDLGELPPETVLPAERRLARALTLSRTTVVTAYQTLCRQGLVERRQGSGTSVSRGAGGRETVSARILAGDRVGTSYLHGALATIDFSTATLPCLGLVPEIAGAINKEEYAALGVEHHGYHPRGLPMLRERIARAYTEAGVPTTPDQILITSGAQQALELITLGCLQPGDDVLVENPTYRGALEAFSLANCRIRSVPCDDNGLQAETAERFVAHQTPRLIYVQSAVHNPTGAVLTDARRSRLARLAERHHVIVVDDTALAGTAIDGPIPTPIAGLTTNERVLTIGSMSKLFWSGLRLGWIRASVRVVSRLSRMKGVTDLGTSLVSQQIAVRLLDRLEEAQAARRRELSVGLRDLAGLLHEHLPTWRYQLPRGGASLWVLIPVDSVTNFAHVALRHGVEILPGRAFCPEDATDDHTRLSYALPRTALVTGVQRLARAYAAYHGDHSVPLHQRATSTLGAAMWPRPALAQPQHD